ncbi:hotdog fold domain-containing protein [Arthrobacter castelli]|uniref:hotdog fold domain-containing protein n=1 Tax=Arthrobacter castelli TaxID=271431 RepID=UPI00040F3ECC|nr:hotdog fold domain-containing protein [Arthrobacter castelli]
MASTYELYQKITARPFGRQIFSAAYMFKAPYFRSVRPGVVEMSPHRAVVEIKKRRAVHNHIGTLHAIAIANGLEAAMGLLGEATVAKGTRWIPKGIQLDYLAKVPGDVRCIAETDPKDWDKEAPSQVDVRVSAHLRDGAEVVRGIIPLWVTAKK